MTPTEGGSAYTDSTVHKTDYCTKLFLEKGPVLMFQDQLHTKLSAYEGPLFLDRSPAVISADSQR